MRQRRAYKDVMANSKKKRNEFGVAKFEQSIERNIFRFTQTTIGYHFLII